MFSGHEQQHLVIAESIILLFQTEASSIIIVFILKRSKALTYAYTVSNCEDYKNFIIAEENKCTDFNL